MSVTALNVSQDPGWTQLLHLCWCNCCGPVRVERFQAEDSWWRRYTYNSYLQLTVILANERSAVGNNVTTSPQSVQCGLRLSRHWRRIAGVSSIANHLTHSFNRAQSLQIRGHSLVTTLSVHDNCSYVDKILWTQEHLHGQSHAYKTRSPPKTTLPSLSSSFVLAWTTMLKCTLPFMHIWTFRPSVKLWNMSQHYFIVTTPYRHSVLKL